MSVVMYLPFMINDFIIMNIFFFFFQPALHIICYTNKTREKTTGYRLTYIFQKDSAIIRLQIWVSLPPFSLRSGTKGNGLQERPVEQRAFVPTSTPPANIALTVRRAGQLIKETCKDGYRCRHFRDGSFCFYDYTFLF